MEDGQMKKAYKISRVIMVSIVFIGLSVWLIYENDFQLVVPSALAAITLGVSYPGSLVSRKMINFGDKLEHKIVKFIYYLVVWPVFLFMLFCVVGLMYYIYDMLPEQNDLASHLNSAFTFLILVAIVVLGMVVPYFQSLIVLLIRNFMKN